MAWTIKYTETALKQLKKLDRQVARRILDFMDLRVSIYEDPRSLGKPLVGPKLGQYWRYRVGDCRVICSIEDQQLHILVIEVGSRAEIYR